MSKVILLLVAAVLLAAVLYLHAAFKRDIRQAEERIAERGGVMPSPHGDIEYTDRGSGPPVLVVHGSGGGWDQGELIAEAALGEGFRWLIPSRFGYLRSSVREGATWDDQANAYAYLLDRLGIDRVSVVAMSHGGPSALLFAVLHPERVDSLTLISCGVVPLSVADQEEADRKGDWLTAVYGSDFRYWLVSRLFRRQFMQLIGATDEVIAGLTAGQRELVYRLIDYMNPASRRTAGVVFDNRAQLPGDRIAAIRAPTLILHARDDTLQLFDNAVFAAKAIPGARLVPFDRGGHVLLIVEQPEITRLVRRHILEHASGASPARADTDVTLLHPSI